MVLFHGMSAVGMERISPCPGRCPFKGALREIPSFSRSFQSSAASGAGEWDWKMMFSRSYNGSHTHTIPRISIVQSNLIRSRALLLVNFFCSFTIFFCLAGHRVGILFQRKNASQLSRVCFYLLGRVTSCNYLNHWV